MRSRASSGLTPCFLNGSVDLDLFGFVVVLYEGFDLGPKSFVATTLLG